MSINVEGSRVEVKKQDITQNFTACSLLFTLFIGREYTMQPLSHRRVAARKLLDNLRFLWIQTLASGNQSYLHETIVMIPALDTLHTSFWCTLDLSGRLLKAYR